jgi:uncharacterized repeat protein (TIGR01451 family)
VDRPTAAVGGTVSYTITLGNTGTLPATAVTVSDVLGGSAGYLVADGTSGTANSFLGQPVVTITRALTGHYGWSYPVVKPGDIDVVRFSAVITAPRASLPAGSRTITLTSTAATPGLAPAAASSTAPFTPPRAGGGVHGARTGLPPTGAGLDAAVAGFLLLGGLGFVLLSLYARERELAA